MATTKSKTTPARNHGRTKEVPQSVRVGIFGASGSGKSYRAREITAGSRRIVFFDPMNDYSKSADCVIAADFDRLRQFLIRNWRAGFRVSFRPEFGAEVSQLDRLCKLLVLMQYGFGLNHFAMVTLVVDELDEGFPSGIMLKMPKHGFGYLCKRGRHFGINVVGISQRTAQVDVCFRGNLSACYVFRQADPVDTEKTLQMIGRQYAAELRGLNNWQYIYKSGNIERVVK